MIDRAAKWSAVARAGALVLGCLPMLGLLPTAASGAGSDASAYLRVAAAAMGSAELKTLRYVASGNARIAGVDMVHIPFKGGAPSVQALLAGDIQLSFATPPSVLPHVKSAQNPAGRLLALAVTSRQRTPLVPGVPGMADAGLPDYEISFWYGFFLPAATPREIVKRVYDATSVVLGAPAIGKALEKEGTETSGSKSPEDFGAFIAEDAKLWTRLVKDSGAKAE